MDDNLEDVTPTTFTTTTFKTTASMVANQSIDRLCLVAQNGFGRNEEDPIGLIGEAKTQIDLTNIDNRILQEDPGR